MATISRLSPVAGVYEFPALAVGLTRVTRYAKNPARVYFTDVQSIDLSTVPGDFRSIVSAAIDDLLEDALQGYLSRNGGDEAPMPMYNVPETLFTLEAISAASGRARMTSARLLTLWHQSHKYVFTVAPKFTELQGTMLLKYKDRVEKIEKLMGLLTGRKPHLHMSGTDLDVLIINLVPEDLETEFGQYIAERCETVRGALLEDFSSAL